MMDEKILREALIEVQECLVKNISEPTKEDYEFSGAFRRKMKNMIAKQKSPTWYYIRKIAIIIILVMGLAGGVILGFDEKVRANLIRWIYERVDDSTYRYTNQPGEILDISSYSLESYIPEGYHLLDRSIHEKIIKEKYANEMGDEILFMVMSPGYGGKLYVRSDNEQDDKPQHIAELNADLYIANGENETNVLVWHDETDTLFVIQGNIKGDELIALAEQMQGK